jgi:acetyltransferase-like isoleucine patch superfamily enzyme
MSGLHGDLNSLRRQSDALMRSQWDRSLPFAETIFDRWERARDLRLGTGTSLFDSVHVLGEVVVGENVWVGPFVILDGSGSVLSIGDGCDISAGVHIYTHDTARRCVSHGVAPIEVGSVMIGCDTYLGSQAVVVPGTTIGSQCVVGANSLVNSDIPDRTIVAGSPARPIGRVEVTDQVRFAYHD